VIYPADHRPAHVHVVGAAGEAVFVLNCPGEPSELREVHDFSLREARSMAAALDRHTATLCNEWSAIHGDF